MRRAGSILPTHQRTKFESTATLCILFTIGDLFAVAAIVYLLSGDKRVLLIQDYNHYAQLWNETFLEEFRNSSFSIQVNNRTVFPTPNTTASGAYYPYRDACSSKKDPPCLQVPVFFWSADVEETTDPEYIIDVANSTYHIPRVQHWSLSKKEINCEGGSQSTTCGNFCRREGGTWNSTTFHCDVTGFLARVCLRLAPVANSSLWTPDLPPRLPLDSFAPDAGCEATVPSAFRFYDTHSSWHPFLYSLAVSPLRVELRHFADPYVRASALTGGCSSASDEERACFGAARSGSLWVIVVVCVIVLLLVGTEVAAVVACLCGKWPMGETASTVSLSSVADLPLEEKPGDTEESPVPPKAESNTEEEGMSTIGMLDDEEGGTMHIATFDMRGQSQPEFEDSFLDSNYEGCEEGI